MAAFPMSIAEIAEFVGGRVEGDGAKRVFRPGSLARGGSDEIAYVRDAAELAQLARSPAGAFLLPEDAPAGSAGARPAIRVAQPELAQAKLTQLIPRAGDPPPGIHPRAFVAGSAALDPTVRVGPLAVVGERVRLGARTVVRPGAVLCAGVTVGEECVIHENAVLGEGVRLGHRVTIGPGSVIGSEGFGNVPTPQGWVHLHHLGTVIVEDDVAIDANVCVDRALFDATVIGRGARIDNLVQIAHNCRVGAHAALAGQVGLSGSTDLGEWVVAGGQAGFAGHLAVGAGSRVGAQAGVSKSWPPKSTIIGSPARLQAEFFRLQAALAELPKLAAEVAELKRRLAELEGRKAGGDLPP